MQLGMIGLGRMGSNMVRRLMRGGHTCVVYDSQYANVNALAGEGAIGADTIAGLCKKLEPPRAVWLMVPAAAVDSAVEDLATHLQPGDIIIDGGNSYYIDDLRRSADLRPRGIHYVDSGVSGGVWGLDRGYCLMVGGERETFDHLSPILATLSPGGNGASPTSGYVYCGPSGAGHFVKMVHNGIEYGVMAAFAEGLNILRHADAGNAEQKVDAETTPLRHPERYRYEFDLAAIAEAWRHGSVIASWLLDLTAEAFAKDPALTKFAGRVSDSGEGRWTLAAAIDESVPAPVLSSALFERFSSRGNADFADKVLSAMRFAFGGHLEKSGSAE